MNVDLHRKDKYHPPQLEIIEVELEEVIANSQNLEGMNPFPPEPGKYSEDSYRSTFPSRNHDY